tara:strand:+ start:347 stop:553 length:207 start_codon:yes stop_codon:yes gene_type:complete
MSRITFGRSTAGVDDASTGNAARHDIRRRLRVDRFVSMRRLGLDTALDHGMRGEQVVRRIVEPPENLR